MNSVFDRDSFEPRWVEYRRIVVVVIGVVVAAAAWYGATDRVLLAAARSSVGCRGREALIAAALRDPCFADDLYLWSCDFAEPTWIAWPSWQAIPPAAGDWVATEYRVRVADSSLEARGSIAGSALAVPPADADRDGRCELIQKIGVGTELHTVIVVRVGKEGNEIVWAAVLDLSTWLARQMRLAPIWHDEDGDGTEELVFITVQTTRTRDGELAFEPPQTVAVFGWSAPGGVLQPRLVPDDCGLRLWYPQNSVPIRVSQTADLEAMVRELAGTGP